MRISLVNSPPVTISRYAGLEALNNSACEDYCLLGCEARSVAATLLVTRTVYSLKMKMEAICFFERSVNFYQTTNNHISEANNIQILLLNVCSLV